MRVRLCADPRFRYVLVESKFTPGKKVWRLVLVEREKA